MELRFWKDPETGLPHICDHGVTEEEVRQVLSRPGEEFLAVIAHAFGLARRMQEGISRLFTCPMLLATVPLLSQPTT